LEAVSRLVREGQEVEVNCRELELLGGSPVQVLLALATEVERRGGSLTLKDAGPTLARIVALAGLRPERL
jgi:anti-anti-sigma regulatory factor